MATSEQIDAAGHLLHQPHAAAYLVALERDLARRAIARTARTSDEEYP